MNNDDIKQQIRQDSIQHANQQRIFYEKEPRWISTTSWCIGGVALLLCLIAELSIDSFKSDTSVLMFFLFPIIGGFGFAVQTYFILSIIFHGGKAVRKGTIVVANKGGEILNSATVTVAKKITTAVEKGKMEAKLEQEKTFLREQVHDLEIQQLQQRIAELEKKMKNK